MCGCGPENWNEEREVGRSSNRNADFWWVQTSRRGVKLSTPELRRSPSCLVSWVTSHSRKQYLEMAFGERIGVVVRRQWLGSLRRSRSRRLTWLGWIYINFKFTYLGCTAAVCRCLSPELGIACDRDRSHADASPESSKYWEQSEWGRFVQHHNATSNRTVQVIPTW